MPKDIPNVHAIVPVQNRARSALVLLDLYRNGTFYRRFYLAYFPNKDGSVVNIDRNVPSDDAASWGVRMSVGGRDVPALIGYNDPSNPGVIGWSKVTPIGPLRGLLSAIPQAPALRGFGDTSPSTNPTNTVQPMTGGDKIIFGLFAVAAIGLVFYGITHPSPVYYGGDYGPRRPGVSLSFNKRRKSSRRRR